MSTHTSPTTGTTQGSARRIRAKQTGVAEGLVMLAGLYLVIAPWLVGYGPEVRLVLSDLVCGLALLALGIAHAVSAGRMRAVSWVIPVIGAWIAVSPIAVYHGDTDRPTGTVWVSNVLAGAIVVLAGVLVSVRPPSGADLSAEP